MVTNETQKYWNMKMIKQICTGTSLRELDSFVLLKFTISIIFIASQQTVAQHMKSDIHT